MDDLERDIIIGSWFRPFASGGCTTSTLVQNLQNGDRRTIDSAVNVLAAGGLLVPRGVSNPEGETVYWPTEKLWRERELALHALRWRKPALLDQGSHRVEDLVIALLMAPRINNARITGPFLPGATQRCRIEISIYLYKLSPDSIESACANLAARHLVREGSVEVDGKALPSLDLTADGVVAYKSIMANLGLTEDQSILDLDKRTEIVVFLVWQSDFPPSRNQIGKVLREVVDGLTTQKGALYPMRIDTAVDVGDGAVRIDQNLLDRIVRADAVVADITPVYRAFGRLTPNPNVLLEVGYALASKKPHQVFLLEKRREPGDLPGDSDPATQLPFDIATVHRIGFSETQELRNRLAVEFSAFLDRAGWHSIKEAG